MSTDCCAMDSFREQIQTTSFIMSPIQEHHKSYSKLAQIHNTFQNGYPTVKMIGRILKKDGNINCRIPSGSTLVSNSLHKDLTGCTSLHIAAYKNNLQVFDVLLENGADFTIRDNDGNTILHIMASSESSLEIHEKFIDSIFNAHVILKNLVNPVNNNGLSHFHIACMTNNLKAVEFFLDNRIADVNEDVNCEANEFAGFTALHFAVKSGSSEIVKILLKHKARIDLKEARGMTPLHVLIDEKLKLFDRLKTNQLKIYRSVLLQIRTLDDITNLLLDSNDVDDIGLSHFHVACTMLDFSVAEYLLQQVSDIDDSVNVESPIWPGYTALHFAAHCNLDTVKILVRKGADLDCEDAHGQTAMDLLLKKRNLKDVQTVLEAKEKWRYVTLTDGKTRLLDLIACMRDSKTLDDFLQVSVDDVNVSVPGFLSLWSGMTILHLAVLFSEENDSEIIRVCLNRRADVISMDARGWTPLHLAYRLNKLQAVNMMLQYHKQIANPSDDDNLSHLHIACAVADTNFVDRLRDSVYLNVVYKGTVEIGIINPGSTLLHVAVASGSCDIVRMLLNSGADLYARDACGLTPIHRFLNVYSTLPRGIRDVMRVLLLWRNLNDSVAEEIGLTRLHIATYCNDLFGVESIGDHVNTVVSCEDPSSMWFNYTGCTPLHMAVMERSNRDVVETLLRRGADILAKRADGMTPLFETLNGNCTRYQELFVAILRSSSDLRRRLEKMSGITMLHIACHRVNVEEVARLLDKWVDFNAKVHRNCAIWAGCTPLHLLLENIESLEERGIETNFNAILRKLLSVGADVTIANSARNSPVHMLFERFLGDKSIVYFLLKIDRDE